MANNKTTGKISAQPRFHQRAAEIQAYGTVNHLLPLELEGSAGDDRAAKPTSCRHNDAPRFVQEIALAGRRADVLPVAFAFRQALRRASGTGRLHRRADTTPRRWSRPV